MEEDKGLGLEKCPICEEKTLVIFKAEKIADCRNPVCNFKAKPLEELRLVRQGIHDDEKKKFKELMETYDNGMR